MSRVDGPTVRLRRMEGRPEVPLPSYATPGSAGIDLASAEEAFIEPGRWASIGTGLEIELPPGHEAQIRPRSGLALRHGITVLNSPGTIDSDYRGEIRVLLLNHGQEPFRVRVGERIAQMVVARVERVEIVEAGSLSDTGRGAGGFGHTGR